MTALTTLADADALERVRETAAGRDFARQIAAQGRTRAPDRRHRPFLDRWKRLRQQLAYQYGPLTETVEEGSAQ
ncbi:hypothetical protein [Streptomyces wuyuanensis]|uniref:hypothetical protein n=1 Tax=Streptomyces wuyuanensis TaxID=1196353 RepID=UPI003714ED64